MVPQDTTHGAGEDPIPDDPGTPVGRRRLPEESAQLAREYADYLGVEALCAPLATFLSDAAGAGLKGVGLAVWTTSRAPVLCLYAMTDLRIKSTRERPSPAAMTSRLYAPLWHLVADLDDEPLDITLSFINIGDSPLDGAVAGFPARLMDPFLGVYAPGDAVTRADLAVICGAVERAA